MCQRAKKTNCVLAKTEKNVPSKFVKITPFGREPRHTEIKRREKYKAV